MWREEWLGWPLSANVGEDQPSFARPATLQDLKTIVQSLDRHGVPYLLLGGYALAAHGYKRATEDIDLMFQASPEIGARVREALLVLPDKASRHIDPAWFAEGDNIRVGDEIVVDIMLNANGLVFDELVRYAQVLDVEGTPIRTVSLEGLLLTKRTMRAKDALDCAVIEHALAAVKAEKQRADQAGAGSDTGMRDRPTS